jgi:hypothetical protein
MQRIRILIKSFNFLPNLFHFERSSLFPDVIIDIWRHQYANIKLGRILPTSEVIFSVKIIRFEYVAKITRIDVAYVVGVNFCNVKSSRILTFFDASRRYFASITFTAYVSEYSSYQWLPEGKNKIVYRCYYFGRDMRPIRNLIKSFNVLPNLFHFERSSLFPDVIIDIWRHQ